MYTDFAERLEIFFGATSDAMCRVYARWENPNRDAELRLAGTLTGPSCMYADTLQANYQFVNRGTSAGLVAEAIMPEPCFWTPEMPQLYTAEVQLRDGDRVVAGASRMFGIRRLGAGARQLLFDGKHWVLRGVLAPELPTTGLVEWHAAETVMCVHCPSDALCDAASRAGVLLVAELGKPDVREIARLGRWPAVGMIAMTGSTDVDLRSLGQNVILAHRLPAGESLAPAPWADLAIVEANATEPRSCYWAEWGLPVIAVRPAGALANVSEGRRQCDRLQRDLAQLGQFAGYIV